jgi:hypothetical protein
MLVVKSAKMPFVCADADNGISAIKPSPNHLKNSDLIWFEKCPPPVFRGDCARLSQRSPAATEERLEFRADALKSQRITRQNLPCTFELDV